jgi:hypothetical protein
MPLHPARDPALPIDAAGRLARYVLPLGKHGSPMC